jgi:hypothetical protein
MLVLGLAACSAACSKQEVTTMPERGDEEICFTVAPLTKAETKTFDTGNIFQTAAFYTPSAFDYSEGENFLSSSVSYNKTSSSWKTATTYYWPKDGGVLSFFSWSLNSGSLTFTKGTPGISITPTAGLTLTDYSSEGNDDFMVADPALSLTGNSNTYGHLGVPTLFRHKTSKIAFKVKTSKAYDGKTFTLTDISFQNLSTSGSYTQGTDPTSSTASTESWTAEASTATTSYYTSTDGMTFAETVADVPSNGTYLFVPQSFADGDGKTMTVNYTIKSSKNTVNKSATISLNKLLGGSSTLSTQFEKGKIYTITLIFSGSEILWNPEVMEWDGAAQAVTVGE